jgi:sulfonate transport system ATP-binding protein
MYWRARWSGAACDGIRLMHNNQIEQTTLAAAQGRHGVALTLSKVRKAFGARVVLDGVDLALAPGEFVAVVGRSGCGKSTLLRAIAGLDALDSGNIGGNGALRMMF